MEEAPYTTILANGPFEIRDYAAYVVAETRVSAGYKQAGNQAFRKLFAYISGDNETRSEIAMTAPVMAETAGPNSSQKIAMTAPVISEQDGAAWTYRFVLPKNFTVDTAPRPLNPDISLAEIKQQRVATIRYSGRSNDDSRTRNTELLIKWIDSEGMTPLSEPRWAGYNAPWTLPWLRRNEVLIDIAKP